MNEQMLHTRIAPKHDKEENWTRIAADFIPKQGEIIVYDIDANYNYERFKIGDGVTTAANLQFYLEEELDDIKERLEAVESYALNVDYNNHVITFSRPLV